jgi:hypothetical protein
MNTVPCQACSDAVARSCAVRARIRTTRFSVLRRGCPPSPGTGGNVTLSGLANPPQGRYASAVGWLQQGSRAIGDEFVLREGAWRAWPIAFSGMSMLARPSRRAVRERIDLRPPDYPAERPAQVLRISDERIVRHPTMLSTTPDPRKRRSGMRWSAFSITW